MQKPLFVLRGTIKDVKTLNKKISEKSKIDEPFFREKENDLSFLAFLEWKNGKTYIIKPFNDMWNGAITEHWEEKLKKEHK